MSDSLQVYVYGLIARIKQVDPERAAQLRRYYSAMRRRSAEEEQQAAMEIERAHGGYSKELYRRGLVE